MISITPGYLADVAFPLLQSSSATTAEAVTAFRSDGRRNCSNPTALRADVERDDCVMMACFMSRG